MDVASGADGKGHCLRSSPFPVAKGPVTSMMLGRVDEVDGHFIATRFVGLIIPTESLYIAPKSGSARTGRTKDEVSAARNGVRIRVDWRSLGLAYARVWLPMLAIAIPLTQRLMSGEVTLVSWLSSVAMIGASVHAHRCGRLSETEKARLRLLGTVTGLRIDPSKLQPKTREIKRASLGELMEKAGLPTTPGELVAVLDDIPMPAIPLVYGYACYAGDDPEWRDCAALVYSRYEPDV